ncbi:hypothetical protein H8356DRAFT_1324885 [Neocallimastix lanati (nom. inval.)]|nr:hypothetical protein H8356DRAFT_1324885 [Neocallimastix sp. JGI-2020a]
MQHSLSRELVHLSLARNWRNTQKKFISTNTEHSVSLSSRDFICLCNSILYSKKAHFEMERSLIYQHGYMICPQLEQYLVHIRRFRIIYIREKYLFVTLPIPARLNHEPYDRTCKKGASNSMRSMNRTFKFFLYIYRNNLLIALISFSSMWEKS